MVRRMDKLLTGPELAEVLHVSLKTLEHWRYVGTGPASARLGRRVYYRERDVQLWLDEEFSRSSTA